MLSLQPQMVLYLSILATSGLAIMWVAFWVAVYKQNQSIPAILASPGFFRTIVVMGVIAATAVLSLAGRMDSNATGAILGGVVGYVLGHVSGRAEEKSTT